MGADRYGTWNGTRQENLRRSIRSAWVAQLLGIGLPSYLGAAWAGYYFLGGADYQFLTEMHLVALFLMMILLGAGFGYAFYKFTVHGALPKVDENGIELARTPFFSLRKAELIKWAELTHLKIGRVESPVPFQRWQGRIGDLRLILRLNDGRQIERNYAGVMEAHGVDLDSLEDVLEGYW